MDRKGQPLGHVGILAQFWALFLLVASLSGDSTPTRHWPMAALRWL